MKIVLALAAVVVAGCGVGEGVRSGAPDATPDTSAPDASFAVDAAPDVAPIVVACEAGAERIEVSGAATITGGCGDAGVPIAWAGGGEDCINLNIDGCSDVASFSLNAGNCNWHGPGSSWASGIDYKDDGGPVYSSGPVTVDDWPAVGGLVSGSFSAGANVPPIQGVFCVRRTN